MKLFLFALLLVPGTLFAADKIRLSGSSTVAPLILEMAKIFEQHNREVRVDVQTGGSSRGVADARKGLVDLGMASRDLKGSENDLVAYTIAVDGVAPVVHASNPIRNLTQNQMRDVFTGKITNWKALGGNDLAIVVVNRAEGRSELELAAKKMGVKPREIRASLIVGENSHVVKTISKNKRAISYMSLGHAVREKELGVPIKLLSFEGVEPTISNVQNGKFPLSRPLNLITKGHPSGSAKNFLSFVRSKEVHGVIKEQSFVPLSH